MVTSKTKLVKPGNVYVLSDGTPNYYKIGKTIKDVNKRVSQLQTGNKLKLTIVYRMWFEDMNKAESGLHRIFSAYRRGGEWFYLDRINKELLGKIFNDPLYTLRESEIISLKTFGLR